MQHIVGKAGKVLELGDEELTISSTKSTGDVDTITIKILDISHVHISNPDKHVVGILTVFANSTSFAITYSKQYKETAHIIKKYIDDKNYRAPDVSAKPKLPIYKKPVFYIFLIIIFALLIYEIIMNIKPVHLPSSHNKPSANSSNAKSMTKSGTGDGVVSMDIEESVSYRCHFVYNGKENYMVYNTNSLNNELAINAIGEFDSTFQAKATKDDSGHALLNIEADGDWTLKYEPIQNGGNMEVSGKGMFISDMFEGNGQQVFQITHKGESNFSVWCNTPDGRVQVVNETGEYTGKITVDTSKGDAFWEVVADGEWSIEKAD